MALLNLALLTARAQSVTTNNPNQFTASPIAPQIFSLPLTNQSSWLLLKYSRIPPNKVEFSSAGLHLTVRSSAMPLIYRLDGSLHVTRIRVRGRIVGEVRVTPEEQGRKGFDDYTLRVGLVEPGTTTLNPIKRMFAPEWIKTLLSLAPPGGGVGKVHFYDLGVANSEIGRVGSSTNRLLEEKVVAAPKPDGTFDFSQVITPAMDVCAVWISSDGDDTKSSFELTIERLELETASPGANPNTR